MEAIVHDVYGPPDVLELRDIERPAVGDDGVLVRVRAASLNPVDWHVLRGEPLLLKAMNGFRAPKRNVLGLDVAGEVEAVGANVTGLRPGDAVFGRADGSLAQYARGSEEKLVPKPDALSWEQAAAIPVAGSTALQAVRDHGRLEAGQSVLVNGAAGGVGTFAVQLAKAFGGEVTAVCSTGNADLVRSLGADHVVDYTAEDFTRSGRRYDLVLQICGDHSLSALRRAVAADGTLVLVGSGTGRAGKGYDLLGPLASMIRGALVSRFTRQRIRMFITKGRNADLVLLAELAAEGKVTPVVDRTYLLAEAAEAIRYLEAGHARGKVVVTI